MISRMLDGQLQILTGTLLNPQQPGDTPMFRFADTAFRVLVAEQLRQFLFSIILAIAIGSHDQITSLSLQKTLGQTPETTLMLKIQLDGGRCGRISPRPQVIHRSGSITLEERRTNGPHKRTFARLVGAVNQIQ